MVQSGPAAAATAQVTPPAWSRISLRATADGEPSQADVEIYGDIGTSFWGESTSAKDFAEQIIALDVDRLNVHINSPGGDAWDGVAIMNALRRHRAHVEVTIDALAASAASVIAMAGDHVVMNRASELMIHDAWTYTWGNAQDLRDSASVLDKLSDSIADAYAARAGGDRSKWRAAMKDETWYTAEEAVLAGLADEWVDAPPAAAHAAFDLSKYRYRGRAQAPRPTTMLPASEPGEHTTTHEEELTMSDILAAGLRDRLGMTDADVTDQQLLAALDERIAATDQSDPNTFQAPAGTVLIDSDVFEELKAGAQEGRDALAAMTGQRRDRIVATAVEEGRIAPASSESWRRMVDRDEEGTVALLQSMPANTIPVKEIGHSDGIENPDVALYASAWGPDEKED